MRGAKQCIIAIVRGAPEAYRIADSITNFKTPNRTETSIKNVLKRGIGINGVYFDIGLDNIAYTSWVYASTEIQEKIAVAIIGDWHGRY